MYPSTIVLFDIIDDDRFYKSGEVTLFREGLDMLSDIFTDYVVMLLSTKPQEVFIYELANHLHDVLTLDHEYDGPNSDLQKYLGKPFNEITVRDCVCIVKSIFDVLEVHTGLSNIVRTLQLYHGFRDCCLDLDGGVEFDGRCYYFKVDFR